MINRLPKEFQVTSSNGVQTAPSPVELKPIRFLDKAARCIGQHPAASLGAAFVIGLILGRVVKR